MQHEPPARTQGNPMVDPIHPVVDELLGGLLVGWSGLRLYVARRRAGQPADATMESLLGAWLRLQLGEGADVAQVLRRLTGGAALDGPWG